MPILLPAQQEARPLTPEGTHFATCFQLIDLGSQIDEYKGEKKIHRKIRLAWELPDELMTDGRPFAVSKDYNLLSFDNASLVIDVNAWRGRPFTAAEFGAFNFEKLIGQSCMMQVIHKVSKTSGKPYTKVGAIMALPKGTASKPLINKPVVFSLNEGEFNADIFDSLPEFLRKMIALSPEYQEATGNAGFDPQGGEMPPYDNYDDRAPF